MWQPRTAQSQFYRGKPTFVSNYAEPGRRGSCDYWSQTALGKLSSLSCAYNFPNGYHIVQRRAAHFWTTKSLPVERQLSPEMKIYCTWWNPFARPLMASAMHIRGINVPNSRLLLNLLLFGSLFVMAPAQIIVRAVPQKLIDAGNGVIQWSSKNLQTTVRKASHMEPTLVCRDSHHSQLYMAVKTLPKFPAFKCSNPQICSQPWSCRRARGHWLGW